MNFVEYTSGNRSVRVVREDFDLVLVESYEAGVLTGTSPCETLEKALLEALDYLVIKTMSSGSID